ncbi:glycosyl hydrolase [Colletotrichum phormii]|uniref:Glycosyl hydrolase n=1 Tax=Colletotrichum phormii TaxID=359342 RepID=A0AAJ0ECE0_9PEZI|nr:glycosyl hydrolase [Colletotrichum phormii]KAK1634642.1 glycosyl hydrolase [Colletotrichum phormii]
MFNNLVWASLATSLLVQPLSAGLIPVRRQSTSTTFKSTGNPILADGSVYSADPAPLVVNDTLYILSGRDEAGPNENGFVMNEWQIFEAKNPDPAGADWTLHRDVAQPNAFFSWAAEGTAYASQIVQGPDGNPPQPPTPSQLASPSLTALSVLVDNGRVYIYFGTFGYLKGYELETDMVTIKDSVVDIDSLTGFFEAPWLMKRNSTYYMLYAANNAGADSPCTPTSYHACHAYGTADSPHGPWTFQGVFVDIVSSTTSHPGVYQLSNGKWGLAYHTRDAEGGTHFRRSVAIDKITWDDSAFPPAINKMVQTKRAAAAAEPTRNIAPKAVTSSAGETPIQYWIKSINDGRVEEAPLPPDYWFSYNAEQSPEMSTLTLTWNSTVEINGVALALFADQEAGANVGVAPPKSWTVEYQDGTAWKAVSATSFPTDVSDAPKEVSFTTVSTKALRAVLTASGSGGQFAGVAIKESFAYAPTAA